MLTEKSNSSAPKSEKQSSRTMTTGYVHRSSSQVHQSEKADTPRMLNELGGKIKVFNAEKVNGVWEQRPAFTHNCVGTIEIPSASSFTDTRCR